MDRDAGHVRNAVQDDGLREGEHGKSNRSIGQDETDVEECLVLGKEEEVEEEEEVDPVAKIKQQIVLALASESHPAMKNVENDFRRMPQIIILWHAPGDESSQHDVADTESVHDFVLSADVVERLLRSLRLGRTDDALVDHSGDFLLQRFDLLDWSLGQIGPGRGARRDGGHLRECRNRREILNRGVKDRARADHTDDDVENVRGKEGGEDVVHFFLFCLLV